MVSTTNSLNITSTNFDLQSWLENIIQNRSEAEKQTLIDACNWAEEIHQARTYAGKPYLMHVITVANILAQLGMDTDVLIAAILHDVIDNIDLYEIKKRFGSTVMKLVDGVAKMKFIEEINSQINTNEQTERLRKMLLAMAEDIRVVLIKLADRLDNMRTLRDQSTEKQQRAARETLELFAPLANRLGIWQIKWELEDLSLRYLEPETYQRMAKLLDERRLDRESYIQQIMANLNEELLKINIKADISGRPKHIYSIWHKMQRKGVGFEEIFDVRAVRILVKTVNECYMALGVIHNKWQPMRNEFDDYIANPKNNNYQSLHTAVVGPEQKVFEVQIRTFEMHHHAELGVASHWRYKEDFNKQDADFEQKIAWLRRMLQWKDEEAGDFIDRFKSEIFEDRVYVLSPQGEVMDLPQGVTPLDFAYHIHTELGHCCRGAKINNRIVPLTYTLKSGDLVEILSSKVEKPSRDWLLPQAGYLTTPKARYRVKQWLKKQDNHQHIDEGRNLLERVLRRLNIKDCNYEQLAKDLNSKTTDNLLIAVSRGEITTAQIANIFREEVLPPKPSISAVKKDEQTEIYVKGVGGLLTKMARCCNPKPYDSIIGYISRERGVVVHCCDCPNALRWQDEGNRRLIEVDWSQPNNLEVSLYPINIQVNGFDRPGLLFDVCSIITKEYINIIATDSKSHKKNNHVDMNFTLEVNSLEQLSRTLSKIDNLTNVMKVWRKS
ncbi:bifunctional (p)ppGpp synthetase/guanosine-3',5'-bis(diphosphate) 3'-pyrophosphohydrolase [Candidatus Halobeggiatoa sp. HSG11]|nr:bifunctional (p)ppGpp synthetase/guanosine-3',5'-bis(diphosphate) 3'-pyrophosphohydrolase [Candidatus Halobeggiatoa sp. HSG11]